MSRPKKIIPLDPDAFDGDPCEGICALLLLLGHNHGRDKFAREAIIAEVERYLEPAYSAGRDVVAMERHQRLQELYARNYNGNGNTPKGAKNYEL